MNLSRQIRRISRDSVRMCFAPLVGSIKGIRAEYRRINRDIEHSRRKEKT